MKSCSRLLSGALVLLCSGAQVARADDTPSRHNSPDAPAPAAPPPPTVIVIQQPAPAPLQPPTAPVEAPLGARGGNKAGVGLGFFALSPTGTHTEYRGDPALIVHGRRVNMLSSQFGLELVQSVVFHDWETMGDAYDWYFTDTDDDPERSNVGSKLLLGWPGLIFIPFLGANLGGGFGGILYTSEQAPSFFVDAGGEFQFMLRPSDDDFIIDIGLGFYAGFGVEFSRTMGMSIRTCYVPPLFHASGEEDRDLRAITFMAVLDFARY